MQVKVLTEEQRKLLPLMKEFNKKFYLVGDTALALQIGHRESIDFDLFTNEELNLNRILTKLDRSKIHKVFVKSKEQYTLIYDKVNLTFFYYPFDITSNVKLGDIFNSVDPLTIGSMKAYALGRRAKWKDYVDLYFILQKYNLTELLENTKKIYSNLFNDRLFLQQLCYFKDINYSEKINFMPDKKVSDDVIKKSLIEEVKSI